MTGFRAFIQRHAVLTYYALVFAISWGGALSVFGPGVFLGTKEISFVGLGVLGYLAIVAGPLVAGVSLAGLVHGRTGLRDFQSRLLKWQVSLRWYAVALLTAPLLTTAILFALSLTPPIMTAAGKAGFRLSGIIAGLVVAVCEESGWTGFAIPELRKRYGIVTTGLIVGLLWGAWHYPLFSGSVSSVGAIPRGLVLAVLLFSWLPPYRVLMVWVYDHTRSILMMMLMHFPLVVDSLVLAPQTPMSEVVTYVLVFAAVLWAIVAALAVTNRGQFSGRALSSRAA